MPASYRGRGVQDQGPGGQVLGLGVGEHGLDELVLADRVAALGAFLGVGDALVDQARGDADAEGRDDPAGRGPGSAWPWRSRPGPPRRPARRRGPGRRSKATSAVQAPAWPILWSRAATVTPVGAGGHDEDPMPLPGGASGSVRANTMNASAARGVGDVPLEPVDDPASPSRRAVVTRRLGSDRRRARSGRTRRPPRRRPAAAATACAAPRCPPATRTWPGDPVVRAEQGPERGAGVAELDGQPHLLVTDRPRPPYSAGSA